MSEHFRLVCSGILFLYLTSLFSSVHATTDSSYLNRILSTYWAQIDADLLTHSFDSLNANAQVQDKVSLQIIHKSLLADLYSKEQDSRNTSSEQLLTDAYSLAQKSDNSKPRTKQPAGGSFDRCYNRWRSI